ncbi:thioesterase family protein [Olleya sp. AS48]|uniref:acyl-CoA thioesterase n=1 Tax=Olleya sp. AS48 TaxID=3135774 RepID=UPI003179387B
MKTYSKNLIVTLDDLDALNHVNNVRYIEWVNHIAKTHWQTEASTKMQSDFYWVLLSHHIEYKHQIVLGDTVRLKTYIKSCQGVKSVRVVEVLVDDKICAYSETKWCLIHAETNKPARITNDIISIFQ